MSTPRLRRVTIIGDSTIDNTVWVKGKPSVVDHLTKILQRDASHEYIIHDYSNDGFTTTDVLNGAYKDKVFRSGEHAKFPHVMFVPLEQGKEDIKQSSHVVLSVGGNNIREFLMEVVQAQNKVAVLTRRMPELLNKLTTEYLEIIKRIKKINPNATIILMTQYYPSTVQNHYGIYEFMRLLSQVRYPQNNPELAISNLMDEVYLAIIKELKNDKNIIIADVCGTLNPHDNENYVCQIEPSEKGGLTIAKLLANAIRSSEMLLGQFIRYDETQHNVTVGAMNEWVSKELHEFKTGEQAVLLDDTNTKANCEIIFANITHAQKNYQTADPRYKAAAAILLEARTLLNQPPADNSVEMKHLKQSLQAALVVLQKPNDANAIANLKLTANTIAPGKPRIWHLLVGALLMLAAVATAAVSALFIPATGGLSAAGFAGTLALGLSGGSLFAGGLIGTGVSRQMRDLKNAAENSLRLDI